MAAITPEDERLMKEVQADPKAKQMLEDKCRWEHMGTFAVLREWGDPRKWDSYSKS